MEAVEWWRFLDSLDPALGYHRSGGWRVAQTQQEAEDLAAAVARQQAMGLAVELFDGADVRRRCSAIGHVLAASYCPLDGHAQSLLTTLRFRLAASAAGCVIMEHVEVLGLEPCTTGWLIRTTVGIVRAAQVIIAAGVWTPVLLKPLGYSYPLEIRTNQLAVTERCPELLSHVITHINGNLTLKQVEAGSVLIGGGWQGLSDFGKNRKGPSHASIAGNCDLAVAIVPGLARLSVIRSWAGFEGRLTDRLPVLGPVPSCSGLWVAASGHVGYTLGPYIGRIAADMILGKPWSLADPARFRIDRLLPKTA
jgi:glycine/D-amino acid oxidase-like deaminating enzyme